MKPRNLLLLILVLAIVALYIDLPSRVQIKQFSFSRPPIGINLGNFSVHNDLNPKFGLDISGGSYLTFEADMNKVKPEDRDTALTSARETVERRVNLFGVSEPVVQTSKVDKSYRVIVELPGITDTTQAVNSIGQTAQLVFGEFKEVGPSAAPKAKTKEQSSATPSAQIISSDLTGKDVVKAQVEFDQKTGKPIIGLTFNNEGAKKFEQLTERNIGKPLPILLDNQVISAPTVSGKISGNAIITGQFTLDEVKRMVALINSGALPVPLKLMEQRTVGPTLGQESIQASVRAGLVGVTAVAFFMIVYYGRLGIVATFALLLYGLFALAIYKLIPVVFTLPGIAGFLLSVGMAVDSNILIFERLKEETRRGLLFRDALEAAFGRAWDSIRDANITTLIVTGVLFNPFNWSFLHTSGPVRGFAATLAIGVLVSLFTGIVVTRTLLRVFMRR